MQLLIGLTKIRKHEFKIGYFGASTGAAAAIVAAAERPNTINAIVSRGGRPDLAGIGNLPKSPGISKFT
jgi:putative phosphoribosyl transferase